MKILSLGTVFKEPFPNPIFTGPDVTRQVLVPDSKELSVTMINFGTGVRNKLHSHDSEQVLIVTSGKGIVATEKEEHPVSAGDVVLISPGEKHWHGAAPGSEFSHIYVSRLGSALTQFEE